MAHRPPPSAASVAVRLAEARVKAQAEALQRLEYACSEYEATNASLSKVMAQPRHSIMVPLGPVAFAPGYLHRTQEIMVAVGSNNSFVECNAAQALALAERKHETVAADVTIARGELQKAIDSHRLACSGTLLPDSMPLSSVLSKNNNGASSDSAPLARQQQARAPADGSSAHITDGRTEDGLPIVEIKEEYHSDEDGEEASDSKTALTRAGTEAVGVPSVVSGNEAPTDVGGGGRSSSTEVKDPSPSPEFASFWNALGDTVPLPDGVMKMLEQQQQLQREQQRKQEKKQPPPPQKQEQKPKQTQKPLLSSKSAQAQRGSTAAPASKSRNAEAFTGAIVERSTNPLLPPAVVVDGTGKTAAAAAAAVAATTATAAPKRQSRFMQLRKGSGQTSSTS